MKLKNKIALLTGGAGGMGSEEARLFVREGAAVVIADFTDEPGEKLAQELRSQGGRAIFVHLDVTKEEQWLQTAETVKKTIGGLHILVNNAGINGGHILPVEDLDTWNRIYAVNVTGPMLGIKTFSRMMRDSGGGSIVNIASCAGTNAHWLAAYSSSKWALRGLSRSAALTLSPWNIRSNTICPGIINTPLTSTFPPQVLETFKRANAIERMGEPLDIAAAVLFLASDESAFITGQDLSVDGGFDGTTAYGTMAKNNGILSKLLSAADEA